MKRLAKNPQKFPDYRYETSLQEEFNGPVAGVDEAGRGPWAGPVVAAAVVLDKDAIPSGLNDSKKLKEQQRELLFTQICVTSLVGIGLSSVEVIDRDNILKATLGAMSLAIAQLPSAPAIALIDGNNCPELNCPAQALVKGDQLSLSIAAASIIAKVTRDRLMREMALQYPHYGFERHKGYGTKAHQQALTEYGITPHHRRSFKPIRKIIEQSGSNS
ncbi:MAG: ribonuclease HII [bacterium]|nr:ribonuclease HII [bacterium]